MNFTVLAILTKVLFLLGSIDAASVDKRIEDTDLKRRSPICGYGSCTKSDADKLNIHIVAHTHDDVGWLKTVDQYYFGERMDIQRACVRDIINSVVDALVKDPNRKFIYVETAFLWKWLILENEAKRETMRQLINEGRLEIIGGGWTMNDEATTHYHSLIDQYTWGFRRLNDTFGECARPKIGWQIDPFGHSREQASMFARLGFDGLLFGRLDYQDKERRLQTKTGEFIWEGSPSLGPSADIFTSVLYNLYQPPDGFCFDILCGGTTKINDDPRDSNYNLDARVDDFLAFVDKQSENYISNNIIITMGGDFTYQDAELYYENIDKLISGINKLRGTKYSAFYSTPSCYLKALNENKRSWSRKTDDFFPYASEPNAYWTGYFSSRPTLKFFERMGNNLLQVVKQLTSLTSTIERHHELELFREAMGILQHHDAVSGTEKQHVANDYARILHHSMTNGLRLASDALRKLTTKKIATVKAEFHSCLLSNVSSCEHSSKHSRFVVTVYNPTSQPLDTYVRLPVMRRSNYVVLDFNGKAVVTQTVPVPKSLLHLSERVSGDDTTHELIFQASNVAPLGYQSFHINRESNKDPPLPSNRSYSTNDDQFEIGNRNYKISVNKRNNVLVREIESGIEFEQSFQYYESAIHSNVDFNRSSGAYVFRPKTNYSKVLSARTDSLQVFRGPLFEEIHQVINDWCSQVIRIYRKDNHVEFDWQVGPIPIDDKIGKEVITKYSSNLKTNDEFYTDSNGREMLKRKLNYRPSWKLKLNETVSANYYPVTAKIAIVDETSGHRLSVLNDRAQGGSSLKEGEIELMIHRRMLADDGFGVSEPLNETAYRDNGLIARGRHILIAGNLKNKDVLLLREKEEAVKLSLRPWTFITPTEYDFQEWNAHYRMIGEHLIGQLPENVRILTLEPWKNGYILLRLEHLFELNESPKYSRATTLNVKDLFPKLKVISIRETTLGANQYIEDNQRLNWVADTFQKSNAKVKRAAGADSDGLTVSLKPMEIRTFLVKLS